MGIGNGRRKSASIQKQPRKLGGRVFGKLKKSTPLNSEHCLYYCWQESYDTSFGKKPNGYIARGIKVGSNEILDMKRNCSFTG